MLLTEFMREMRNAGRASRTCYCAIAMLLAVTLVCPVANAAPWLNVGDRGLRSDVELLASHGLITGLVTTWPIPAGQLEPLLDRDVLAEQVTHVRRAAARVLDHIGYPQSSAIRPVLDVRLAESVNLVRGFGQLARSEVDVRAGADWQNNHFAVTLRAGVQSERDGEQRAESLDGTYLNALWGNLQFYGGWADQWYGPGSNSSLILSNNARPFPKIGLMRNNPEAFESRWLRWMGPVQINFFVGLLDGPRIDSNTLISALRFAMSPVENLEFVITRMAQFCGANHPCRPVNVAFSFSNDDENPNDPNEQSTVEFKYHGRAGALSISPYAQLMNEDTGPFAHSTTSYLGGVSLAAPWGERGMHWRVTAEYADSVSTRNWFSFGKREYGIAYNNFGYADGTRYRDRTLGFSLDSDSKLFSMDALLVDARGWQYRLAYHNVRISTPQLALMQANAGFIRNVVSAEPVQYDQVEAGLSVPWRRWSFGLSLRAQDDQIQQGQGSDVSLEGGFSYSY